MGADAIPLDNVETAGQKLPPGPALYIVATPIGNLEDMTLRAIRVLREADFVYCEDTRKTSILKNRWNISTPLRSYRVHRLDADTAAVIAALREGNNVALVSEAGTPGISDPGSHLVREAKLSIENLPIIPIPGPVAFTAALSVSGFQTNPALYLGFLSPKRGRRKKSLSEYSSFPGVIAIYESVHRIEQCLIDITEIFPDREILVAREITKKFEDIVRLEPPHSVENIQKLVTKKGEFTILIGPQR